MEQEIAVKMVLLLLLLLLLLSAFIKRTFADATNALKTAVTL